MEGNENFCISLNENFKGINFVLSGKCLTNSNNRGFSINDILNRSWMFETARKNVRAGGSGGGKRKFLYLTK